MITKKYKGMKYRKAGDSGLWLSEIGLGLWKWGDPSYDGSRVGEHEGFEILDRAMELGVTHWDNANSYNAGSGNSERLLGKYFSARGADARDKIVLATKIRNSVRDKHETKREFTPNELGSSRKYIISAVDGCLQRLKTDYIDILYHHFPDIDSEGNWETPLEETWSTFHDLIRSGKVRYLAVSNRSNKQLLEENEMLNRVSGFAKEKIIAVQNRYNLVDREKVSPAGEGEQAFIKSIQKEKISLIPLMPLAVGFLTGRYTRDQKDTSGRLSSAADQGFAKQLFTERNFKILDSVTEIAAAHSASPSQIAVAWLLSREYIPSVITGVTKLSQLEDNSGASMIELAEQELNRLDTESAAAE